MQTQHVLLGSGASGAVPFEAIGAGPAERQQVPVSFIAVKRERDVGKLA